MPNRSTQHAAIPLHLTLSLLPWIASQTVSELSKQGWTGSSTARPDLASGKLGEAWAEMLSDPLLASAVEKEARTQAVSFLEGLERYRQTDFTRDVQEPPVFAEAKGARLLAYSPNRPRARTVLLVPSLINRYTILDLTQRLSFARYLSDRGFAVFVLDWGAPDGARAQYSSAAYVTDALIPLTEQLRAQSDGPLIAAGYCMGGLLTLALACLRPDLADAAAFLATPWDFDVPGFPKFGLSPSQAEAMSIALDTSGPLPAETIHTLFQCVNPFAYQDKLRRFARMDLAHSATQEFLAIEHWVNEGVPMASGVARDCLIHWLQHNVTARGRWHVGRRVIDPAQLNMPCFVAAPKGDQIVPSASALALARVLKRCTLIEPGSGHVGMMVGSRRKAGLWEPFADWAAKIKKLRK